LTITSSAGKGRQKNRIRNTKENNDFMNIITEQYTNSEWTNSKTIPNYEM